MLARQIALESKVSLGNAPRHDISFGVGVSYPFSCGCPTLESGSSRACVKSWLRSQRLVASVVFCTPRPLKVQNSDKQDDPGQRTMGMGRRSQATRSNSMIAGKIARPCCQLIESIEACSREGDAVALDPM